MCFTYHVLLEMPNEGADVVFTGYSQRDHAFSSETGMKRHWPNKPAAPDDGILGTGHER